MNRPGGLAPAAVADLGAFLARLLRLDPGALVRLRPSAGGVVSVWSRLPFDVLATRLVRWPVASDATVRAAELLAVLERGETELPARHDLAWRSALPPDPGEVLEEVPTRELRRIADAAAATIRSATGRAEAPSSGSDAPSESAPPVVGERRLRDELLDHVALIVTHGDRRDEIPVRLVQGVVRMGFLGPDDTAPVRIRRAGDWLAAEATYGTVWYRRPGGLRIAPVRR